MIHFHKLFIAYIKISHVQIYQYVTAMPDDITSFARNSRSKSAPGIRTNLKPFITLI